MGLAPRGKNILTRSSDSLFAETKNVSSELTPEDKPASSRPVEKLRSGCIQKNWLIPQALSIRVKLAAAHSGKNESQIVRDALDMYLHELSKKLGIDI